MELHLNIEDEMILYYNECNKRAVNGEFSSLNWLASLLRQSYYVRQRINVDDMFIALCLTSYVPTQHTHRRERTTFKVFANYTSINVFLMLLNNVLFSLCTLNWIEQLLRWTKLKDGNQIVRAIYYIGTQRHWTTRSKKHP